MKKIITLFFFFGLGLIAARSMAQSCSDLFISEYVEGSSFNKAIEIYNPTTGTVQLDGYELLLFSNGNDTASFKMKLHGPLATNHVYVICAPQADNIVILLADTTDLVCNWNGNDAVALVNTITGDTIDVIGVIGEDPGTEWTVAGGGSTKDHSLVRSYFTQEGTSDWAVGSTEWDSYGQNDFSNLGSHSMNTCPVTNPEISVSADSSAVPENIGSFNVNVNILNPNAAATSADVMVSGGTATQGSDYSFSNQTVTFPANSSTPIHLSINVVNDGISEPDESIEFSVQNATNNATISASTVTVKIVDDDGLGVAEVSNKTLSLFPNPTPGELHIQSSFSVNEIRLLNVLGEEIMKMNPSNSLQQVLRLDKFPDGIYFLKVYSSGNVMMKEVVKK